MERIAALYRAHRSRSSYAAGSMHQRCADEDFPDALTAINVACGDQAPDLTLYPAAVTVLTTLDHEWDRLARHEDVPDLALDTNTAERGLHNSVVGHKNFYAY